MLKVAVLQALMEVVQALMLKLDESETQVVQPALCVTVSAETCFE